MQKMNMTSGIARACTRERPCEARIGHDHDSYRLLRTRLSSVLTEAETFRIDHFLAKELVENLMALLRERILQATLEPTLHPKRAADVQGERRREWPCRLLWQRWHHS